MGVGFLVEPTLDTITSVTGYQFDKFSLARRVRWSPDGQYVAAGGNFGEAPTDTDPDIRLFKFIRPERLELMEHRCEVINSTG